MAPLSSLTFTKMNACGFCHSTCVTIPVKLAILVESYSASKEWCAAAGTRVRIRPITRNEPSKLSRISLLPEPLADECRFCVVLTEIFRYLFVRNPLDIPASGPSSSISLRIVHGHLVPQGVQVRSGEAFRQVQGFGVGQPSVGKPEPLVEAD